MNLILFAFGATFILIQEQQQWTYIVKLYNILRSPLHVQRTQEQATSTKDLQVWSHFDCAHRYDNNSNKDEGGEDSDNID